MSIIKTDPEKELLRAERDAAITDAKRYRKLRNIAIEKGSLEAEIALGMFDFMSSCVEFDNTVDAMPEVEEWTN